MYAEETLGSLEQLRTNLKRFCVERIWGRGEMNIVSCVFAELCPWRWMFIFYGRCFINSLHCFVFLFLFIYTHTHTQNNLSTPSPESFQGISCNCWPAQSHHAFCNLLWNVSVKSGRETRFLVVTSWAVCLRKHQVSGWVLISKSDLASHFNQT